MQLFNYSVFQHIFLFFRESFFDTMISSKKVVTESRARVNEAKISPKTAKNCKYIFSVKMIYTILQILQNKITKKIKQDNIQ